MVEIDPGLPRALIERCEAAEEALALYRQAAVMSPMQVAEARRDFRRFYTAAAVLNLRGIRWNFDGCILCPPSTGFAPLHRILVLGPAVLAATDGRAFGTLLCKAHAKMRQGELTAAALRRIREAPPRDG